MKESKKLLEETYLLGRQVGNINLAFYALVLSEIHSLFAGTPLKEVLEKSVQYDKYAANQREKLSREYFFLLITFCQDMMEPDFKEKAFQGKNNEIEALSLDQQKAINFSGVLLIQLFRNLIELLQDNNSGGEAYLARLQEAAKIIGKSSYQLSIGHLVAGLKILRQPGSLDKEQHVLIKKALIFLEKWYKQMPANHAAKHFCLLASYSRKRGKYAQALHYINQAIDSANENNFTIETALCWEEKYKIQIEMNEVNAAQESLRCAYVVYEKWGASAKLKKLKQQQSITFIDKNAVSPTGAETFSWLPDNIDVMNLIKLLITSPAK